MDIIQEKKEFKTKRNIYEKLWLPRSTLEKRLIFIATIFIFILVVVILLYIFILKKPEICTSSTCLETSMNLLNQINVEVNPCHDFYKFSCGNFLKNTNAEKERIRSAPDIMKEEIQSRIKNMLEQPVHSEHPRSFNLAKEFYRSCMNESVIEIEGLKWMKQIFRKIGGWPTILGDDWIEDDFDWKKTVYKLRQMGINFEYFIAVTVEKDQKDSTKYILQLSDPYKNKNHYIEEETKRLYLRYMEDVAVHFGSSLVNARLEQKDVLEFTLKLARISEEGKKNNLSDLYNPYVLSELQYDFTSINWYDYLNGILAPTVKIRNDEQILVSDPHYMKQLEYLLLNTNKRVLANFMAWNTLQHLINFMPTDLVNKAYEYMETINGEIRRKPRWKMCVNALKERMGPVVSSAYIEQYFDEESRLEVTDMFHNIKRQFKQSLNEFIWIDQTSKRIMFEKLLNSATDIISYDDMNSLIKVRESYNDVKIYHDNILLSVMNLDQFALNVKFHKLRRVVHRNWLEDPDFVTGIEIVLSSPYNDILVFPIGVLGGIYYGKTRPKYLNYGALGSLIAQKIWQSLTEAKREKLDSTNGNWWSSDTLLNYEQKLKCLGITFGRTWQFLSHRLNVSEATEEDLAYLIGVKISYDAYKSLIKRTGDEYHLPGIEFTPSQLFWIYFSGPSCDKYSSSYSPENLNFYSSPNKMRINGIVGNLQEFSEDFDCSSSDNMNLDEKCNIF